MSDDDFEIEDILSNLNKKEKRKNTSKKQGNRGELDLSKVLNKRFPGKNFFRVIGSGNRWSQVELTEELKGIFTSDIVCPPNFKFCIECKYGYGDFELCSFFAKGHKEVDGWLEKVIRDAAFSNKMPILCWRKPYHPWNAFIKIDHTQSKLPEHHMVYGEWVVVSLDYLLARSDEFWFNSPATIGGGTF